MTTEARAQAAGAIRFDRSALRIERIETIAIRAPLPHRFSGSAYHMDNRCTIVTRLHTADGLVSEVYNGDTDAEQELVVRIIHDELAPALMGRSASDPEGAWRAMEPATNDILRDRGLALQAIACLDTALWDVFGKALGEPIHRVWGSVADELPIIIIGGYYETDDALAARIGRYAERGFAGCKFKVGGRSPAEDAERVRVARDAAGADFAIAVDANQGWTRAEAVDFGMRVRGLGIRWFEEPCRWTNDRRWMRDVRLQTAIPVAAGQSERTLAGLRDLVMEGAIDVSNFDASESGGPTIWRKAAGVCAAFGVEMAHHEEPLIGAQLLASVPHHTFVECFDEERDPLFWNLSDLSGGFGGNRTYRLPERAGFGIELDWDYVDRYTVNRQATS
ncbi:MAG: mandelate racemase/muconate lactonizing enzyme family protein [Chloroflexota bacterium]|nr:mandelate racemase/muconate lactonizing enzyme family protein [Chloroflexota bacterium]